MQYVINFTQISAADIKTVGGKNANLGKMIGHLTDKSVNIPGGFCHYHRGLE